MMVIIKGSNRVEFCQIKKKDFEKKLFRHRDQLYAVFPDNLIRMRFVDDTGNEIAPSEEVTLFKEGA